MGKFIFNTDNYASQPTSIEFDDFIRIFYTFRNNGFSQISFIDVDKKNPSKIQYKHKKSILNLGTPGTFDEHGTMMGDILYHENKFWLYYIGWQKGFTVPYITTLGLAISDDGVNFEKVSNGPVIGLNKYSPFGVAKISILIENNKFNMWYTHYNQWYKHVIPNEFCPDEIEFRPTYDIRFCSSNNGIDWNFEDKVCILNKNENEAIGAPCVRKIDGNYHMWYGYRESLLKGEEYKMGYAFSKDKLNWARLDNKNIITKSKQGWDSEMVCYPNILNNYLFYSGNKYGKAGFGYKKIKNLEL